MKKARLSSRKCITSSLRRSIWINNTCHTKQQPKFRRVCSRFRHRSLINLLEWNAFTTFISENLQETMSWLISLSAWFSLFALILWPTLARSRDTGERRMSIVSPMVCTFQVRLTAVKIITPRSEYYSKRQETPSQPNQDCSSFKLFKKLLGLSYIYW